MIEFSLGKRRVHATFSSTPMRVGHDWRDVMLCALQVTHPFRVTVGASVLNPDDVSNNKVGQAHAFKRAVASLVLQEQKPQSLTAIDFGKRPLTSKKEHWVDYGKLRATVHEYYSAYRTALWLEQHQDDECTCSDELPDGRQSVCKKCVVQARATALADCGNNNKKDKPTAKQIEADYDDIPF